MNSKSIEELEKLVKQRNTAAMNELAYRYRTGKGCEKDDKKSAEILKQAVQLGSKKAKYSLAVSYYFGLGITKETKIAFDMFNELADKYEEKK